MQSLGYAVWSGPEGVLEMDTVTCNHCNTVVHIDKTNGKKLDDYVGGCRLCGKLICLPCVDKGVCVPFEKKLDQAEARERFYRQVGV